MCDSLFMALTVTLYVVCSFIMKPLHVVDKGCCHNYDGFTFVL